MKIDSYLSNNKVKDLNLEENVSFEDLNSPENIHKYFKNYMPHLYSLVPDII